MRTKVNAFLRGSMRVLGLAVVAAMMAACERTMIGEDWDVLRNVNGSADVDGSGDASGAAGKQALKVMTRSGDGESAELTLLSPNEKQYTNVAGVSPDFLQTKAAEQGTDGISGWRLMTRSEAGLLQAAHTALGIDDARYYLFDDSGTAKQMRMSDGTVSTLSTSAVYVRPVATVTVSKE